MKRRPVLWALLAAGLAGTALAGARNAVTTPRQVLALASAKGVGAAMESLSRSGQWQITVLPGIAAAQPDWLTAAHELYAATDAGTREELNQALAGALPRAPYRVLPLLKEFWWSQSETLCVFDYDSELPGGVARYARRLKKALAHNPPAELEPMREACMRGVGVTEAELRKRGG